jgi:hypothetical protein
VSRCGPAVTYFHSAHDPVGGLSVASFGDHTGSFRLGRERPRSRSSIRGPNAPRLALALPQHPNEHRPERLVLLAVDQELGLMRATKQATSLLWEGTALSGDTSGQDVG